MLASKCGPTHARLMRIGGNQHYDLKDLYEEEVFDENALTIFVQK